MGLQWTKPKRVINGTKLVINAAISTDKSAENEALWSVWKAHKEKLKQDGFSIKKAQYGDQWSLSYWHTITDNTDEKSETGEPLWQVEFEDIYAKWVAIYNQMKGSTIASAKKPLARITSKPTVPKPVDDWPLDDGDSCYPEEIDT
jgi:hypothetical protein